MLLHGWTGSKEDFGSITTPLAEQRRVVVPDLPGHGSAAPAVDGDYGLEAHANWVLAMLDGLGLDEVHLLGHSHGGLVAQRLAYVAADRIRSLTLVGSGLGALGDRSRQLVERVALAARDHGVEAAWEVFEATEPTSGDRAATDPDRQEFVRRRFLAMPAEAVVGVARNLITAAPLGAFVYGIDVAVLVCHGEGDTAWLPHEQRLLARRIPTACYRVVPDAEHSPAVDNPQGMVDLLVPFLARQDASQGALQHAPGGHL